MKSMASELGLSPVVNDNLQMASMYISQDQQCF